MPKPESRSVTVELAKFDLDGQLCSLIVTLYYSKAKQTAPDEVRLRVTVDGNIDDDASFVLNWDHLRTSDGFGTLPRE